MWWRWKCKPLSWLWGLIPLALLGLMAVYSERSAIENDLRTRSIEALRNAGMDWANPSFNGRDGVVLGKALSADEKMIALDALRDVEGVRIATDNSSFSRPVSPYLWSAEKEGRKLVLSGYVPTIEMRDEVLRETKSRFPRLFVSSKMQVAPGKPRRVDWKDAIKFGLSQIKGLKKGSVHFVDERFTVKGDALRSDGYRRLQENLENDLPEGVRLQENLVNPPVQSPFVWKATKEQDKVTLTGFVPNKAAQNRIRDMVKRKFPDSDVDDKTLMGSGEPSGWENVLRVTLGQLSVLEHGEAKISNKNVYFKGRARSKRLAERVKNSLKSALPTGFKTINEVTWRTTGGSMSDEREPDNSFGGNDRDSRNDRDRNDNQDNRDDRFSGTDNRNDFDNRDRQNTANAGRAEDISPYSWSVTKRNDAIIIGGYVLDEEMRNDVLRQASHSAPDFQVIDNMKIGSGGLGKSKHMMVADYAFQRLSSLEYGSFTLRDNKVRLSGEARRDAFRPEDLDHSLLPEGVSLANARIRPAKVKNYHWNVARKGNEITLSGFVPNKQARKLVIEQAKQLFPSLDLVDQMKEASGVPDGLDWQDAAEFCLKQLDGLKSGQVGLRNRGYHLVGTAWSFDDQKKLELAKAYIPTGFNLDYQRIQLPIVEPYIWRIDFQDGRITLSGNVPNQAAKQEMVIAVEERFPGAAVIDQLEIAAGASSQWADNVKAGIFAVGRLSQGSVTLIDREMTVRGIASNDFVKKEIAEELRRSLARNIRLENKVRVNKAEDNEGRSADYEDFEKRNKDYMRVTDEELNSSSRVEASTCERYLNTLVNRTSITFSPASAKLNKNSYRVLEKLAFIANRCGKAVIEIAGHTDSDGAKKFNHFLSFKRARSVAEFLIGRGVGKDRLVAVGYGETRPIVSNNSKKNKEKNRRIEFVVKERF